MGMKGPHTCATPQKIGGTRSLEEVMRVSQPRKKLKASCLRAFTSEEDEQEQEDSPGAQQLTEEGHQHALAGRCGQALGCWERALQLCPNDGRLHELRAQMLNEQGRCWEAVQAASQAAQLLPVSSEVHVTLARAQLNLGEPLLALGSMEKALMLDPANAEALAEVQEVRRLAHKQRQLGPGVRAVVTDALQS